MTTTHADILIEDLDELDVELCIIEGLAPANVYGKLDRAIETAQQRAYDLRKTITQMRRCDRVVAAGSTKRSAEGLPTRDQVATAIDRVVTIVNVIEVSERTIRKLGKSKRLASVAKALAQATAELEESHDVLMRVVSRDVVQLALPEKETA